MSGARRNPLEILCEVLEKELNKSERRFKRLDADCEKMFSTLGKKTESELSEDDIVKFVKLERVNEEPKYGIPFYIRFKMWLRTTIDKDYPPCILAPPCYYTCQIACKTFTERHICRPPIHKMKWTTKYDC